MQFQLLTGVLIVWWIKINWNIQIGKKKLYNQLFFYLCLSHTSIQIHSGKSITFHNFVGRVNSWDISHQWLHIFIFLFIWLSTFTVSVLIFIFVYHRGTSKGQDNDAASSQDDEQPGSSRRERQPSMSETMPLYTLCKEDLESMDKEVFFT